MRCLLTTTQKKTHNRNIMSTQQLTLNINLRDGLRFNSYYTEDKSPNAQVIRILQSFVSSKTPQQNILWGAQHSGKTHLLQACCSQATEDNFSASYIPLETFKSQGIDILSGLSQSQLLVLDDIDCVIGNEEWEIALFNLINNTREKHQRLLMSSTENPRKLNCIYPDLASRLIWGGSYQLQTLTDEDKPKALQARAEQRGFELSDRVIDYLYRRYPRDIESLMTILDQLDKESLRQKTVITVPFVKQVLEK